MNKKFLYVASLAVLTNFAMAATSMKNEEFNESRSNNQLTLTSKKTVIILTKDCKASSPQYGVGKWEWANGGYEIKFKNKEYIFGNYQEVSLDDIGLCRS
jgi:hypothetical protein